jgi:hypothetical protein
MLRSCETRPFFTGTTFVTRGLPSKLLLWLGGLLIGLSLIAYPFSWLVGLDYAADSTSRMNSARLLPGAVRVQRSKPFSPGVLTAKESFTRVVYPSMSAMTRQTFVAPVLRTSTMGTEVIIPFWSVGTIGLGFVLLALRPWAKPPHGACRRCGYDLQGVRDNRCPECGRDAATPARA